MHAANSTHSTYACDVSKHAGEAKKHRRSNTGSYPLDSPPPGAACVLALQAPHHVGDDVGGSKGGVDPRLTDLTDLAGQRWWSVHGTRPNDSSVRQSM